MWYTTTDDDSKRRSAKDSTLTVDYKSWLYTSLHIHDKGQTRPLSDNYRPTNSFMR